MADPRSATSKQAKSTGEVVSDLWALLKDYGRQETIDPLKNLGRFLAWGSAGAVCLGLAGIFLAIGLQRLLQVEVGRNADGNWSLLVYFGALVLVGVAAGLSVLQIKKKGKTS